MANFTDNGKKMFGPNGMISPTFTVAPEFQFPDKMKLNHSAPKHDWGGGKQGQKPSSLGNDMSKRCPGFN